MSAHLEELIVARETRGSGSPRDPLRSVVVIYKKDGTKIAEHDPFGPEYGAICIGDIPPGAHDPRPCGGWFFPGFNKPDDGGSPWVSVGRLLCAEA